VEIRHVHDELGTLLAAELAEVVEPPIGDLAERSLRRGRRLRTVRRWRIGGTMLAVLLVLGLGSAAGLTATGGRASGPDPVAVAAQEATPSAPPSPPWTPPPGAPATGPRIPATAPGLLVLLLSLLPQGSTGHYAASPGGLLVQTYLDTGGGPGMLRVGVARMPPGTYPGQPVYAAKVPTYCAKLWWPACAPLAPPTDAPAMADRPTDKVLKLSGGALLRIIDVPGNCVQRRIVAVERADGIIVQINIATCLAWDGRQNPPAPMALTDEQATAIAQDRRWGTSLAQSLVRAGAITFPRLPLIR
jgi:hypothetical protein